MQTTPERNAEYLLPGKTEQAVRRIHAERRAAAAKKGDKCIHPCCVKAAKAGKVCDHCNEPAKK
jgi:hypothetical protein